MRTLDDGCIACNLSHVACHAMQHVNHHPCCGWCEHESVGQ